MSAHLRHALREEQFRRYETLIVHIVHNWPRQSYFTPEPPIRSLETLRARLRDAMLSLYKNKWSSAVDNATWQDIFPHARVGISDNKVVVYKIGTLPKEEAATGHFESTLKGVFVTSDDLKVIESLFVLHHHGILTSPSTIKTTLTLSGMFEFYDVSIQQTEPNTYLIL